MWIVCKNRNALCILFFFHFLWICVCMCSMSYIHAIVSLEIRLDVMNLKQRAKHTSILSECAMSFFSLSSSRSLCCRSRIKIQIKLVFFSASAFFYRRIRKLYTFLGAFFLCNNFRVIRKLLINDVNLTGRTKQKLHSTTTVQMEITLFFLLSHPFAIQEFCTPEKFPLFILISRNG